MKRTRSSLGVVAGLSSLFAAGCTSDTTQGHDAAAASDASVRPDGQQSDAGPALTCTAADCAGQPVPAIACADGPTLVLCQPLGGMCHVSVRCGPREDAGADRDASTSWDGGPGQSCGGIAALRCPAGWFCDYASAAGGTGCQGIADASGTCALMPEACPAIYAPVCGCNSHSYPSACDAHASGASVKHNGLCTAEECTAIGGRPEYSNGASTPMCLAGESSFAIPGIEPALCCTK